MIKDNGVQGNKEKRKLHIILCIMILTLLLLAEVYLMLNFPKSYIFLLLIGAVSLFLVYRIANSVFILQDEKEQEREDKREKEFESIFKSEKATYLLMRKNFAELADMLFLLKGESGLPLEDLISAQKSIAKVTINKSKEHSTAVINSNEELKGYLEEMNGKFTDIQNAVKENMDKVSEFVSSEMQSKNLDVILRLNEIEKSISSEMEEKLSSINISPHVMMEPEELSISHISQEEPEIQKEEIQKEENLEEQEEIVMPEIEELKEEPEEIVMPEIEELKEEPEEFDMPEIEELKEEPEELVMPEIEELDNLEPRVEPLTDNMDAGDLGDLEEKVRELQQMAAEEEPEMASLEVEKSQEDLSDLMDQITPVESEINPKMTPEEIEQLINENNEEEFVPEIDLSNISEEIPSMEEIDKMLASIPMPEEHNEPEPVEESPVVSNDANHVMTPDEIAKLIGETPLPEPEPVPEPEPAPTVSAPSNDANHVMTPDEIAALLASV
ncbi:MAG: hypothetical protein HFI77_05055 [Lachnospiraceae bacterium]|nr:hypothetical protein [Lachnospiraceae bacterium]